MRGDVGALIRAYILEPLGMQHTFYDYDPGRLWTQYSNVLRLIHVTLAVAARDMAVGYDGNGNPVPWEDLGWAAPCGTMYASVHDLGIFDQVQSSSVRVQT
jgi:CubicO group peptidase (beta-lactamase class C family)